jgi:putative peptidoglycan lipid II flippase
MPTLSAQHALGQLDEMRASLAASLRGVILLALPASIGLILLRHPIVAALYQRGEFTARSTELVAWALLWYAAGLVGHSIMEVLTRAFYAQHDTKTPVIIGTVAMTLNVLFSIAFSGFFEQVGWLPLGGLALANSLATALEATALFIVMRKRLVGIEGNWLANGTGKAVVAVLAMSASLVAWTRAARHMNDWIIALGGVAIGGFIYGLGLVVLRVSEVQNLILWARNKISQ